ncbi:MAG: right-handed parallel beta-helix repeat-containing protein [Candidatus Competibacteraceae bacterium]|nr:right-handed parallel beta-helix repeat-containing protein [Candidatus Competibacteraceae bacterium]
MDTVEEDSHVVFHGRCHDPIRITKDKLSIIGQPGSKFIISSTASFGIAISGRQVDIKNIDLSGGKTGIVIYRGGSAEVSNSRITNAGSIGIEVTGSSYAHIEQTEIINSRRNGVVIRLSSSADIHDNKIRNNNKFGIVIDASAADIDGNLISRSGRYGILLRGGAKVRLGKDNASGKGNLFYNNSNGAIRCESNSVIEIAPEEIEFDYDLSDRCVLANLPDTE